MAIIAYTEPLLNLSLIYCSGLFTTQPAEAAHYNRTHHAVHIGNSIDLQFRYIAPQSPYALSTFMAAFGIGKQEIDI